MFTIIACIGRSNELGKDGNLIWRLPSDMKFFRQTTTGHTIIMGRKTFDSLGGVLPNRHHVVITHADPELFPEEVEVVHSFAEVFTKYRDVEEDVFIIGGG
ncbi:MAG: dihydrofolate reductase, partial [Clostridia bacterium]|nr:dihydrofolate reductase [Clostridia bacterium]